ncbi:hypothetical protein PENSPDRAFT_329493 [Peniophora sp. CONT]|nr:hypothetical protein PENSPDRAFT_329493 [Peniophora sp. CONT]
MKFSTLFVATLVGLVSAAPMQKRTNDYSGSDSSSSSSSGYDSSSKSSDSSSYGSSSSNSGSSNYGSSSKSSSSSDCGSMGCDSKNSGSSSSAMMMESTSTMMAESTSTAMMMSETTTTAAAAYTTAASSYSYPSYGSGSSSYGSSSSGSNSYDSCVQQCVAQFGAPSSMSMPSSTSSSYGSSSSDSSSSNSSSSSSGSSGSGATHTVIVAPTQGVLRYVPFAVNASVGDTVKFVWMASPHTVTKSSQLEICNKTSDAPFTSGVQNASFVFEQVVNSTDPTFFYCGVPGHCQKGMFGIINPPNAFVAPTSVNSMMPAIAANNSGTAAAMSANAAINGSAANWGASIDLASMPDWAMGPMADNVLYTRSFMAANSEAIGEDGQLDFSRLAAGSMMVPPDVSLAAASSSAAPANGAAAAGSASAAASAAPSSTAAAGNLATGGAGALASPRVGVAIVAIAAAFFAL